jgi:hypothetical protein
MKESETTAPLAPAAPPAKESLWYFHGLAARMESVGISMWSWLLVLGLSLWLCAWLFDVFTQLAQKFPH